MDLEEMHISGFVTHSRSDLEECCWDIMTLSNHTIIDKMIVGRAIKIREYVVT